MVANFVKKYTLTRSLPNSFCTDRNSLTTKKEFEFYCLYSLELVILCTKCVKIPNITYINQIVI